MAKFAVKPMERVLFMYLFGQTLTGDGQFYDHIEHEIPIQIYLERSHTDIGFIEGYSEDYIKVNQTFYNRKQFTFVSRPGY
ncbi:MAG: hypothetical protein JWM44_438 [Bacilli bacterium]|jgi:hypothetical protein|nr:hypothetical protein [Bacilli bacterium]